MFSLLLALTLSQLTPGNPDYLYAKSLLDPHWDEQGQFHYLLPEQADQHQSRPASDNRCKQAEKLWRQSLPQQEGVVYGESVHRNEFGIDGGIFWSPDSSLMAFYRMDESMVAQYPLVQTDAREAEVTYVRYPMAGMTSHQVTVGIYNPETGSTVYLNTNQKPGASLLNDPEHYLACITWRPDGRELFIAELNRPQNYMELNRYDVASGNFLGTVFSMSADRYVEPEHPLWFLPGSNDRFLWLDERDGFDHLYLYDLRQQGSVSYEGYHHYQGLPFKQITKGEWVITDVLGIDPKGRSVYFLSTADGPTQRQLYSADLRNGKLRRLTPQPGLHHVRISPDYTQAYDVYSNATTPRECQLIDLRSGRQQLLYSAPDPYEGYARPQVQVGTITAADGTTPLYYRMVLPLDFDPSRRYPAIVYLYNGPHAQLVTEGYQHGLPGWDCYMAQLGYVVFTVDGRGSANRGLAFEQAIWHQLGLQESLDQMQGVAFLRQQPFIDDSRLGIYGWSYGGFMSTYMMLHYSDVFKVGVCGGPVLDWSRYEVMYGERYMGTPETNPEGYEASRLVDKAGMLKGHLLVIHDDQDATVVPQMSFQFLRYSVAQGTYPDFIIYPNHEHNVRGVDRVHLLTRIASYFQQHL